MTDTKNNQTWLTVQEASSIYKFKLSTLYLWVEQGTIPHYKVGKLIRFKADEVDEWLRGCKKSTSSIKASRKRRTRGTANIDIDKTIRKAIDGAKGFKV